MERHPIPGPSDLEFRIYRCQNSARRRHQVPERARRNGHGGGGAERRLLTPPAFEIIQASADPSGSQSPLLRHRLPLRLRRCLLDRVWRWASCRDIPSHHSSLLSPGHRAARVSQCCLLVPCYSFNRRDRCCCWKHCLLLCPCVSSCAIRLHLMMLQILDMML